MNALWTSRRGTLRKNRPFPPPRTPRARSRYITNGGGGWGDPRTRPIARVVADMRDGYVSLATARAVYGVAITGDPVFDPAGLVVDEEGTRALRM